ncbi:hypothetical protein O1V64_00270 (plasmid) [Rouxiella badensis]|nr:hypothetical protein O1V64_00445 [Rouxiella badensis]WAT03292.1 hypothetical protein O1V64_00270 [Rouxiella badensis]
MKKIAIIGAAVVALILVISLVSCHDDTPSQTAVIQAQEQALTQQRQIINQLQQGAAPASSPSVVAPAPVIVQQPAVVNNGDNGLVTGMVLGHLLSGGAGYSGSHTTVVNHYSTTHTAVNATRPVSRSSFFPPVHLVVIPRR